MKKYLSILLSVILLFFTAGCGGSTEPVDQKQSAQDFDSTVWSTVLAAEATMQDLTAVLNKAANGQATLLDLYDAADTAEEYLGSLSISFSSKEDIADDYVDAAQNYIVNAQLIASGIRDYIDTNEMSYLSDANGRIDSVTSYLINIVSARMDYLSASGFSEEEISEILGPSDTVPAE